MELAPGKCVIEVWLENLEAPRQGKLANEAHAKLPEYQQRCVRPELRRK